MKKKFVLNIMLATALGGICAMLFAEEASTRQTATAITVAEAQQEEVPGVLEPAEDIEEAAESAAAGRAMAGSEAEDAGTAAAGAESSVNASAAPAMSSNASLDSPPSALGGASAQADSVAPGVKHYIDGRSVARNYYQQPPMVPHKISEYKITLSYNKCMSCHSWGNYQQAKATKISQTHFKDREGKDHSTLAARRYFCNQCHVPQVDAKPLVENQFIPVNELK